MAGRSAWRVNDVVAYDVMRGSANSLTAILLRTSLHNPSTAPAVDAEIRNLRRDVLIVDAYDREAVSALTERIRGRIHELAGSTP